MSIKLSTTDGVPISVASHIVGLYPDSRNTGPGKTGYSNCIIDVDDFVSTDDLAEKGYATKEYVDALDEESLHKNTEEVVTGRKEFQGGIVANTTSVTINTNLDVSGTLTASGQSVDFSTANSCVAKNPALDAAKNTVATLQTFEDKFKVVSSLPVNPDPNVFYFVTG